jgi:AAA domain
MWHGTELVRPDLPKPNCRVKLVCGPPASGKSTYVRKHAGSDDIVIDLDDIAKELGFDRARSADVLDELLAERNARLAKLANAPRERLAWVILTAPAPSLRTWWRETLGVLRYDQVVLVPPRAELYRRVFADPDRTAVRAQHIEVIDKWFQRERDDDPGAYKPGYDVHGHPTDPLHPWFRASR